MGLLDDIGDLVGGVVGEAGGVLKTAVETVNGISTQIFKQKDVIDDLVSKPLSAIVQKVQAGEMWKGPNADNFVQQCQQNFLTEAVHSSQGIFGFGGALQKSVQAVVDADNEAASAAEELMPNADAIGSQLSSKG